MKLYCAILALGASSASAFVPQGPKAAAFKALHSTPPFPGGPEVGTESKVGVAAAVPQSPTGASALAKSEDPKKPKADWSPANTVRVQGGSLRTWSFATVDVQAVQVRMKTGGRPLNANVDLWQGPDNTPQKMGVYIEDGNLRPFNVIMATPWGQNTVACRNTAQMEFPFDACVEADMNDGALLGAMTELAENSASVICQGGAVKTYSFSPSVSSVQVLIGTDGRPLNARIELLQGPNNNKQVMEVYTEDGLERPFFSVIETPASGNVVRIQNTSPLEFPIHVRVEPYMVDTAPGGDVIIDGGNSRNVPRAPPIF
eukprot:CAMPEP_0113557402 /NCGR_PEP_ID=MMETSP0015_2-20120614/17775_1 /TAXON_ID=2838 /ORGANISM="Odontella" /LENGTH=314 /DNA_ID=CAMNT_0000458831 /DNA_START=44 /DNA_END=988 /DNA_ORIENTATION=- /assembly_acc=CAM_ASM_000160